MNYLVAVFPDRMVAEEAYTVLEKKGIKSTILGRGYKSADEFGLIDPKEEAKKQAKFMSYWLVPFGFVAGFTFSLITGLNTFAWAGEIGNHFIGGLLGAGSGALGAIFVGGGVGLVFGGGDALPYRNRLDAGKYIVVVEGPQSANRETTRILRQLEPENIQGYAAE
ncbi:hypothetical protein [Rivularia sp. UHCC 0363]|uniref:hypothetical protein n=1 Tax=Rivularia sp. UHCC 0363 TaxID=3110244 RepID=UPI002B2123CD|nr:hypothetical protein [Rivularia sp. UHCC 0363]MEA5593749.1 hypothetical protein [Rivularia sp. UHCC 0363]